MGLPFRLEAAINAVAQPGTPHTGGLVNLPHPGLTVAGLALSLPLSQLQARQLAEAANRNVQGHALHGEDVIDVQVDAAALQVCNPAWMEAMRSLKERAMRELGVDVRRVELELDSFVVYGRGGRVDVNVRKGDLGMLVVQLPSCVEGGDVVLGGVAYGGGCWYGCYYNAAFADVQRTDCEVLGGFKAMLVYRLLWKGEEEMPCAKSSFMWGVVEEVRKVAWPLIFGLDEWYKAERIGNCGLKTLKPSDTHKVQTLQVASKMAGFGDVDIFIAALGRTDMERYDLSDHDDDEDSIAVDGDAAEEEEGRVFVERIYDANGQTFGGKLDVDWKQHLDGSTVFDVVRVGRGERDGDDYWREVTMGATAVVMWPKDRAADVLSGCSENVKWMLERSGAECARRVEQVLQVLKCEAANNPTWQERANLLLDFCITRRLARQACDVVAFACASSVPICEGLMQLVRTFGWEESKDAVRKFFGLSIGAAGEVASRIVSLHELLASIPAIEGYRAMCVIVTFVECRGDVVVFPDHPLLSTQTDEQWKETLQLWELLFRVIDASWTSLIDRGYMSALDDVVFRLVGFCNTRAERQLHMINQALTRLGKRRDEGILSKLCVAVHSRLSLLRTTRFVTETAFIVQHKVLPDTHCQRTRKGRQENWRSFLTLAEMITCADNVIPQCTKSLQDVLDTFAYLPYHRLEAIREASSQLAMENDKTKAFVAMIHAALDRVADLQLQQQLLYSIGYLIERTQNEPSNIPVTYDGGSFGDMPEVQDFLQGDQMDLQLVGFNSVMTARRMAAALSLRLPHGIEISAGGPRSRAYVKLAKPFAKERMAWVNYHNLVQELHKTRAELSIVQSRLRKGETEEPCAKRRKEEGMEPGVHSSASGSDSGRRISPASVSDFLRVD